MILINKEPRKSMAFLHNSLILTLVIHSVDKT